MSIAYQRASRGPIAGRLAGKVVAISEMGGGQGRAAALLFARSGTQDRKRLYDVDGWETGGLSAYEAAR